MIYNPVDSVAPKICRLTDRALGGGVTLSLMEIITHTGTHIDAPLHFIADGSTISDMPLDATVGPVRVIEIKDPEKIRVAELEKYNIKKGERLLFKTRNSPRTMNLRNGLRIMYILTILLPTTWRKRGNSCRTGRPHRRQCQRRK
jgi:kynurenine formamidase